MFWHLGLAAMGSAYVLPARAMYNVQPEFPPSAQCSLLQLDADDVLCNGDAFVLLTGLFHESVSVFCICVRAS